MKIEQYMNVFYLCSDVEKDCLVVNTNSCDGWEPYAAQTDNGEWKKIILLDVYN